MTTNIHDIRRNEQGNLGDPVIYSDHEPELPAWYVTDPRSRLTQRVEADAESTARWIAWSQWYGTRHRTDDENRHYTALEVIPA